jgi:hypothetical protein
VETWSVAFLELSSAVPNEVLPLKNVTVPVGVPLLAFTVAVKLSDWPYVSKADEALSVVQVGTAVRSERSSRRSKTRTRRAFRFRVELRADRANEPKNVCNMAATPVL